jgi:hypothetical protein
MKLNLKFIPKITANVISVEQHNRQQFSIRNASQIKSTRKAVV